MTLFEQLQEDLGGYLDVSAGIVERVGAHVNAGEEFKLRLTLTNSASPPTAVLMPVVIFNSPYIQIHETEYATPVQAGTVVQGSGQSFPVLKLEPGESTFVEFEMKALRHVGEGIAAAFLKEQLARVAVSAHLDTAEYFKVWNKSEVYGQIHPPMTLVGPIFNPDE